MKVARLKRVLILELEADGHHPFYLRLLLESGLADCANIVVVAQPRLFTHAAIRSCAVPFEPHPIELAEESEVLSVLSPLTLIRRNLIFGNMYRRAYRDLAAAAPVDFVIVPYLDDCLLGLAAPQRPFGNAPWLAITMRTMFHYGAMGVTAPRQRFATMRRLLTYRMLRQQTMQALLTIDPTLAEFAARHSGALFRKIRYVPDPAAQPGLLVGKREARRRLGLPPDASIVLVYGEISWRKGIFALLEAVASPECVRQVHVLFAGRNPQPEHLANNAAWQSLRAQQRAHSLEGYIDTGDEALLLQAADCMWVGYTDFYGVSSVMALAGRNALPVIASDQGLVGHLARRHGLGALVQPRERGSILQALNRLVNEPDFFHQAGTHGVTAFQGHDPGVLQRTLLEVIGQAWSLEGAEAPREMRA